MAAPVTDCPTPQKIAYRTRARAHRAITRSHLTGSCLVPLRVYSCRCGAWHLTSVREWAWRARRAMPA